MNHVMTKSGNNRALASLTKKQYQVRYIIINRNSSNRCKSIKKSGAIYEKIKCLFLVWLDLRYMNNGIICRFTIHEMQKRNF